MHVADSSILVRDVSYRYGTRTALDHVSLEIGAGEIFALVGPNGSGKTTLFRLITTLIPMQSGEICVLGCDVMRDPNGVRRATGVVFQSPSLDLKLTVRENLYCQAALVGMREPTRSQRIAQALVQLGLEDRADEIAQKLSGGLRRRADLARGILAQPALLLLDEPTTALDPAARAEIWRYLESVRRQSGTSIVFTTHLLEEAERADRLAILDQGRVVICDRPDALKQSLGGDVVTIQPHRDVELLCSEIASRFDCRAEVVEGRVRIECEAGPTWVPRLAHAFPEQILAITTSKPTLEDVFVHHTGHRFWSESLGTRREVAPHR